MRPNSRPVPLARRSVGAPGHDRDMGTWLRFKFSFKGGNASACKGVSRELGFSVRDRGDLSICPRRLLERPRPFWSQGYRAMMVTDTAFYRYRHYHMPSDTPDKLAYPELTRVTSGLFAAFTELAREGVD